ncbi:MAG: hypothetical protein QXT26_08035 [Thermoproteota archaeon]
MLNILPQIVVSPLNVDYGQVDSPDKQGQSLPILRVWQYSMYRLRNRSGSWFFVRDLTLLVGYKLIAVKQLT